MKFVTPFNTEIQQMLHDIWHHHSVAWCRTGAHAIFLSAKGYKIPQISQVLETERRAVSRWLDNWEAQINIEKITGKQASCYTFKRLLKKSAMSENAAPLIKTQRDANAFAKEQQLQTVLHQADSNGELKVYYVDAARFFTIPCVPYAWQPKSDTLKLLS